MSRSILAGVVLAAALSLSGCVSNLYTGGPSVAGGLYTNVTDAAQHVAVAVDTTASSNKRGTASAHSVLGLVALGDASIDAAMKQAGITKVHHVDHNVHIVLFGFYAQTTTIVYGE